MKVVLAGGGTAGHVNPALALAEAMEGDTITFVGTTRGAEARLVPAAGRSLELIEVRGFDRAKPLSILATGYVAARAIRAARRLLERVSPHVVVGMGGYVSLPVCLAARSLRVPVVLHEQNIVFGLANKVCRPLAARIAVSFEETLSRAGERGIFVGNPVSAGITDADRGETRRRGFLRWDLEPARKTLLVFGGSQGAQRINEAARELRSVWRTRDDRQIVHITGGSQPLDRTDGSEGEGLLVRTVGFVERMVEAYAVADLALCRGGATSVAELTAVGLPSLIVPYPHHRDRQQERHGRVLERAGAALVLLDEDTTGERVAREADRLLEDESRLAAMGRASLACGNPGAAQRLAEVVREVAA